MVLCAIEDIFLIFKTGMIIKLLVCKVTESCDLSRALVSL